MASNGFQVGFEDAGAFPEEDALASGADLEELARYAMRRGNYFKGPTSARNAWVSDGFAREGHAWYDTTLDRLFICIDGSSWASVWGAKTSFSPGWSNFIAGASSISAWYQINGNVCEGSVRVILGSGFGMNTSNITLTPPVTPASVFEADDMGSAIYLDNGSGYVTGKLMMSTSGAMQLMHGATLGIVTNAAPFGWATGDRMSLKFRYEVA